MIKNKSFSQQPKHIAIIMDGNGRWAQKRGLQRLEGHKAGIKALERTIDALQKFNIRAATFFAFSTENWKRSKQEIDGLFDLVRLHCKQNEQSYISKGIRVTSIGDLSKFPPDLVQSLERLKEKTKNNDGLIVNLALNYGGQDDVVRAVNKLLQSGKTKITKRDLVQNLYTNFLPDPDLIIRTSGEKRLSNFLMFQSAYSELYFTDTLWPDFDEKQLLQALNDFAGRQRRYGGIK